MANKDNRVIEFRGHHIGSLDAFHTSFHDVLDDYVIRDMRHEYGSNLTSFFQKFFSYLITHPEQKVKITNTYDIICNKKKNGQFLCPKRRIKKKWCEKTASLSDLDDINEYHLNLNKTYSISTILKKIKKYT